MRDWGSYQHIAICGGILAPRSVWVCARGREGGCRHFVGFVVYHHQNAVKNFKSSGKMNASHQIGMFSKKSTSHTWGEVVAVLNHFQKCTGLGDFDRLIISLICQMHYTRQSASDTSWCSKQPLFLLVTSVAGLVRSLVDGFGVNCTTFGMW